jgi:flagellar basal body rod protein FlgC
MSLAISTSGLDVNQFRMNSTAHNVANTNTENCHAHQGVSSESAS